MREPKTILDLFRSPTPKDEDEEWLAKKRAELFEKVYNVIGTILKENWDPNDLGDLNDYVAMLGDKGIASVIPADKDSGSFYLVLPDDNNFRITPTYLHLPSFEFRKCYLVKSATVLYVKGYRPFAPIEEGAPNERTVVIDGEYVEGGSDYLEAEHPEQEDISIFPEPLRIIPMRSPIDTGADSEAEAFRLATQYDELIIRIEVGPKSPGGRTHH